MNPLDLIILFFDTIIKIVLHKPKNYVHSRDRRNSPIYRKKQKIVKNVWTASLILMALMLQFPYPILSALVVIIGFLTTIISFVILDEI